MKIAIITAQAPAIFIETKNPVAFIKNITAGFKQLTWKSHNHISLFNGEMTILLSRF